MRDYERPQLFEIAWEVANRGKFFHLIVFHFINERIFSWWYLYGP